MDFAHEILTTLLLASCLIFVVTSRLMHCIRLASLQGIIIGVLPLLTAHAIGIETILSSTISIAIKGIALPILLIYAVRRARVPREIEPFISYSSSLVIFIIAMAAAFYFSSEFGVRSSELVATPSSEFAVRSSELVATPSSEFGVRSSELVATPSSEFGVRSSELSDDADIVSTPINDGQKKDSELRTPNSELSLSLPTAMITIFTGLFLIITRRKAITQAIGFLVFENGIGLFGQSMALHYSFIVELGILLDVFVLIFVMGIALFQIRREFHHIDTDKLVSLGDTDSTEGTAR